MRPGLRKARGPGWGGGAARSPGPRPGNAGAAHASPASASMPPANPSVPGTLPGIRLRSRPRGSGSNSAADECAFSLGIAILHEFSSWGWFSAQPASVRVNAALGWGTPGGCWGRGGPSPLEFVLPSAASAGVGRVSSGWELQAGASPWSCSRGESGGAVKGLGETALL